MLSAKTPSLLYTRFTPITHRVCRWAMLAVAFIIAQQSLSVSNAQGAIPYLDKVVHFIAYGGLGLLSLPAFPNVKPILVILALGVFGGLIEISQGMMGLGRTPDVFDALSNLAGAFMALVFWQIVSKFRS